MLALSRNLLTSLAQNQASGWISGVRKQRSTVTSTSPKQGLKQSVCRHIKQFDQPFRAIDSRRHLQVINQDERTIEAVVRNLEIIGEAARRFQMM